MPLVLCLVVVELFIFYSIHIASVCNLASQYFWFILSVPVCVEIRCSFFHDWRLVVVRLFDVKNVGKYY